MMGEHEDTWPVELVDDYELIEIIDDNMWDEPLYDASPS